MSFIRKATAKISQINPEIYFSDFMSRLFSSKILEKEFSKEKFRRFASYKLAEINPDFLYLEVDGLHWGDDSNPRANDNGDAFHEKEIFRKRSSDNIFVYQTWNKKGVFRYHQSEDIGGENHIGIILDTFPDKDIYAIKMLTAIDKAKDPKLIQDIEDKKQTDVSMGCIVEKAICSECNNIAYNMNQICDHVKNYKGNFLPETNRKVFEWNYGVVGTELSFVGSGADTEAKVRNILADFNSELVKVGSIFESMNSALAKGIGSYFTRVASKKEFDEEDVYTIHGLSNILENILSEEKENGS